MGMGILEVKLVNGKGLQGIDPVGDQVDPYVLIKYMGREHMSRVARNAGANPVWNEKFKFQAEYPGSGGDYKIIFKVMGHDTLKADDLIGQFKIDIENLLASGVENGVSMLAPKMYSVLLADLYFKGEVQVGVSFSLQAEDI